MHSPIVLTVSRSPFLSSLPLISLVFRIVFDSVFLGSTYVKVQYAGMFSGGIYVLPVCTHWQYILSQYSALVIHVFVLFSSVVTSSYPISDLPPWIFCREWNSATTTPQVANLVRCLDFMEPALSHAPRPPPGTSLMREWKHRHLWWY